MAIAKHVEFDFLMALLSQTPYFLGSTLLIFPQAFLQDLSKELRPRGRAAAAQPAAPGAGPQVPALRQHVQEAAGARRAHQATHRREAFQVSRVIWCQTQNAFM